MMTTPNKGDTIERQVGLLVVDDLFLVIILKGNDQTEQTQLL
jgi:hypothetical protein